ncbi:MAG TPA: hypothetical protein VLV30_09400 [Methanomicrobiales archaeon]|nr:hypothetical protein [Methanomicrobiales archaeon]
MKRRLSAGLHYLVPLALVILLASPAAATLVLSGTTLTPPSVPLAPGQGLTAVVRISVIPSGSRTFSQGHNLQMETDLTGGRWSSVVYSDGIPADRENGQGRVFFLPGFVLSYTTNHDIAIEITVQGTVPAGNVPVTVMTVKELDNSGMAVAGGTIAVIEPVSAISPAPTEQVTPATSAPSPSPSSSPSPAQPSPSTARIPGFGWETALAGVGFLSLARALPGGGRKP